jgi:TonB-linked SusC/RagA family outer membrane protein
MLKTVVFLLLLCCCLGCVAQFNEASGRSYSFTEVINELRNRNYAVAYPSWLDKAFPNVVLNIRPDMSVGDLLHVWLAGLEVGVQTRGNSIVLFLKGDNGVARSLYARLEGVVVNAQMQPLAGATVMVKSSNKGVVTNSIGYFRLGVNSFNTEVTVSCVGYAESKLVLSNRETQMIVLAEAPAHGLDVAEVVAYGVTTRRWNIGASCTATGINSIRAPGGNLQEGLEARVPGLFIAESNGVAGSARSLTIGGKHSLQQNNDPLYVIDGVPLARDGFLNPIRSGSPQGDLGGSPLNFIAPDNIAGVTILKDAAATSIYGSRGSNGVVIITLKSGKAGPLRLSFDVSGGLQEAVKTSPPLSTAQFLSLRREGMKNDGAPADSLPAEAVNWDANRQTNFQRLTIGRKAPIWNAGLQASWGSARSVFFLSGQLHRESTVFPGSTLDDRRGLYGHWRGQSVDGRLKMSFSGVYSHEDNHLPAADYTADQWLAPNAPAFTDKNGNAQWVQNSLAFVNIPALANNDYKGRINSFLGHLQVSYRLGKRLYLEENLGYNGIHTAEASNFRVSGQPPGDSVKGTVTSANNRYTHSMTETIGRWSGRAGPGALDALLGFDYQSRNVNYLSQQMEYPNDPSLNSGSGGKMTTSASDSIPYRYYSVFGRVTYNIGGKYLLTSSWRRDRSEILGSKEPVGNFWTIGGGWVFSKERFLAGNRVLSFGKLRGSWGTTGNEPREDLIQAEAAFIAGFRALGGNPLAIPRQLPVHWELNHREDLAVELGFLQDRLFLTAAFNRGWTSNQLITNPDGNLGLLSALLSNQKGIDIENRAFEFQLQMDKVHVGKFWLASSLVLTVPRNRIRRWPGLAGSIYESVYTLGHPVSSARSYQSTGVDPATGLYTFRTNLPSGIPDVSEMAADKGLEPAYYAGWNQRVSYGNWELEWLFDYRRQRGINPLIILDRLNAPGTQGTQQLSNGPREWLDHWRKPGDISQQQRPTAGGDTVAANRLTTYESSDAYSIDASYLRLRNVTLSYRLPLDVVKKLGLREGRISLSAHNLFTWTHFPVTDPETQDPTVLPPMRIIVAAVHIGF